MCIIENLENIEKINKKSPIISPLRDDNVAYLCVCVYTHIHLKNKIWLVYGFISCFLWNLALYHDHSFVIEQKPKSFTFALEARKEIRAVMTKIT